MRCPDCSKFVSFDTDVEPEFDDPQPEEVAEGCEVDVYIVNTCAECGAGLKTADLSVTLEGPEKEHDEKCGGALSLEFSVERTEESRGLKPNPPARYCKHYYGVKINASVKCDACDFKHEAEGSDECPGSSMDEC